MDDEEILHYSVLISALFLEDESFPHRIHSRHFNAVFDCLARSSSPRQAASELGNAGLWEAAARLSLPGILVWAETVVRNGRAISVFHANYPRRLKASWICSAPPALWVSGKLTHGCSSCLLLADEDHPRLFDFARDLCSRLAQLQIALVTWGQVWSGVNRGRPTAESWMEVHVPLEGVRWRPFHATEIGTCVFPTKLTQVHYLDSLRLAIGVSDRVVLAGTPSRQKDLWREVSSPTKRSDQPIFWFDLFETGQPPFLERLGVEVLNSPDQLRP